MSIESKHAYRFGYLKSDQWKTVRLEALVREKGKCQICGEESIHNDAHHAWYPENIYETTERHLVILCRACHDFIHAMLPDCKTRDEEIGMQEWAKFRNAIITWRLAKVELFQKANDIPLSAGQLRGAYETLKARCQEQATRIREYERSYNLPSTLPPEQTFSTLEWETSKVMKILKGWAASHKELKDIQKGVDSQDFII